MAWKSKARSAVLLLSLCAAAGSPRAQSIAASLSGYTATLRVPSVAGISAKSFSGAAFHPDTRTLYVIDNDNAVIYELRASGTLIRAIATSGFLDPEGITYHSDDFFMIAEEGLGNIVRIKIPRTGDGPVAWSSGTHLNIAQNLANSGIEGISYNPADNTAYAVKETAPPRLYRIALDAAGSPAASFPDDPFSIGGKTGDAADILALKDGNFILVNQEENRLEGYDPKGRLLSTLSLGMAKPEGVALDTATGTLYAVGEPLEFAVFKNAGAGTRNSAPETNGASCVLSSGRANDGTAVIRYFLPHRAPVRIEFAAPDGAWIEMFRGDRDEGSHSHALRQRNGAVGVGFYRFSAGTFRKIFRSR